MLRRNWGGVRQILCGGVGHVDAMLRQREQKFSTFGNDDPYFVKIINQENFESAHREEKLARLLHDEETGRRVIVLRHRPIIN